MSESFNKYSKCNIAITMIMIIILSIESAAGQTIDAGFYDGLVFGMGWGTFLILFFIILGAILVLLTWTVTKFTIIIAVIIPCLLLLILYFWPKEDEDTGTTDTSFDEPNSFFLLSIGL